MADEQAMADITASVPDMDTVPVIVDDPVPVEAPAKNNAHVGMGMMIALFAVMLAVTLLVVLVRA